MISLNDYLYSGDTVLQILKKYARDLEISAEENHNEVDRIHVIFLKRTSDLLEHNDFLTAQSQKIREFSVDNRLQRRKNTGILPVFPQKYLVSPQIHFLNARSDYAKTMGYPQYFCERIIVNLL